VNCFPETLFTKRLHHNNYETSLSTWENLLIFSSERTLLLNEKKPSALNFFPFVERKQKEKNPMCTLWQLLT
jgi:hypothetical protein